VAATVPPAAEGEPAWIVLTVCTLVGIITAYAGGELTPHVRRGMNGLAVRIVAAARAGEDSRFRALFIGAVSIHAAAGFALGVVGFLSGQWLLALYFGPFAGAGVNSGIVQSTDALLSGLWPALLGVGAAVIGARFVNRKSVPVVLLIAVVSGGASWLWLN
jgi:hypothetical protein